MLRWGEPRATRDVDVTLVCPFGGEARALDRLLGEFKSRIEDARDFAMRTRVLLLWSSGGIGIDIALGGLPFEERCAERASDWTIAPGTVLRTCSAEDLVVLKAFAARPRDWLDVETVLVRRHRSLDWQQIDRELEPLAALRETPEVLEKLKQLKQQVEKRR